MNKDVVNELHKPVRAVTDFRSVNTKGKDDVWSVDLVEMKPDEGYKFIMTCIDCFTRYAWAVPMKSKSKEASWDAFKSILSKGRRPNKLWVDAGGEFYNSVWEKELGKLKIGMYSTGGNSKAVIVERFNRTLKTMMYKEFSRSGKEDWVAMLPRLLLKYNTTSHSSVGMSPEKASKYLGKPLEYKIGKLGKPKYKLNDWVRIQTEKGKFGKGYTQNWTKELFRIVRIDANEPVMYHLVDINDEEVKQRFYENELLKSNENIGDYMKRVTGADKAPQGDYVVKVLSWRYNPASKAKFNKYLMRVQHRLGSIDEIPLGRYVGTSVDGVFKETSRNPDQILQPIADFVKRDPVLKKDVWDKL